MKVAMDAGPSAQMEAVVAAIEVTVRRVGTAKAAASAASAVRRATAIDDPDRASKPRRLLWQCRWLNSWLPS